MISTLLVATMFAGQTAQAADIELMFDESALIEIVRVESPERYDHLMREADVSRERYLAALHWDAHTLLFGQKDPEKAALTQDLWVLQTELVDLALDMRDTRGQERDALREEITLIAEEMAELQQVRREQQVEALRLSLAKAEAKLQDAEANHDREIRRAVRAAHRDAKRFTE